MKRFVSSLIFITLLLLVTPILAQDTLGDLTLRRGVGIRAAGMGAAGTATMIDGSAIFYNPANLADQPGLTYTSGNPNTKERDYTGSFELLKLGYIGYGYWKNTFSATNEAAITSVGFGNKQNWLNWGLSFKTLNWKRASSSYTGWTTDIGFLARITPQLNIGLLAQDLLASKDTLMPAAGRLGFGFTSLGGSLTLAGDIEYQKLGQLYTHLGLEAQVLPGLAVRTGLDRSEPTAGLSLDLSVFSFDYAALFAQNGQTTQRYEVGIRFLPERQRPFSIFKPKEYALIDVSGALKGGRNEYSFLGGRKPGLDSILSQIRLSIKDPAIDGILLKLGGFSGGLGGMAMVQEIAAELKRARLANKKIVAFIGGSALGDEYYLASFADKIMAPPGAAIGGLAKGINILRLKGLFKKIGVEWQVFAQGEYKDAFNPYSEGLTEQQEKMLQGFVANLYRQMITDVAQNRGLEVAKVKSIGDGMFFTAKEAKAMGLIDEIGYYKDILKYAARVAGDKKNDAKIIEPQQFEAQDFFLARVFGVAVIEIDGEIVSGQGGENIVFGGRYVGSEKVIEYLKKASDNVLVKAIILRINSPGGSAIAAGEIYKAVKEARKKGKLIIASIGNMGASGGYYIAAAADKIVADPASVTGSIGVIGYLPVYSKLLEKLEIKKETIKEGQHADMFSGLRALSTVEAEAIKRLQADSYDDFIEAVAQGRGLTSSEVEARAKGQLYTGQQAYELDLVDRLGGLADAIDLAKQEAKIAGEPRLIFYHQPSFFFNFGSGLVESLGLKAWSLMKQSELYN